MLLLVRHAMPLATKAAPSGAWALTADGRAAARQLRARFPAGAHLTASCERKAWETVGGTDTHVERDARFDEIARTGEPWGGDFLRLRRRYVEGVRHAGWESHEDAAGRFHAGVVAAQDRYRDRAIVIGTHGMVLTNWLVSIGVVSTADAGGFWSDLGFPDCIEVDTVGASWRRCLIV
ncbi:histidine phosphatase family protein [Solicola gregarius]|uniref:Histidine phosphatase family protein n=1 Tax=Solicola gregarius TaxID=2908642 RepID=A0AA46YIU4_9ACTN|nr:histidine phosphatase family protein [Solicola gregarius]UYM03555.1 histidine phosphatase family protein [Solicola gregarius]